MRIGIESIPSTGIGNEFFSGIATELTKKADLESGKDKTFNDRPDPNIIFWLVIRIGSSSSISFYKKRFFIHHVPPARATDKKLQPRLEKRIEKRDHAT